MIRTAIVVSIVLLAMLSAAAYADVITDWNSVVLQEIRSNSLSPPVASRALAMVHGAMYDAVNDIDRKYTVYKFDVTAPPKCSPEAAAAAAAHRVLINLVPKDFVFFDCQLNASLSKVPDGPAKTNGVALGQTIGDDMVAWRTNDGSVNTLPPYLGGTNPGEWRPTPPGLLPGLLPNWPTVIPFVMTSGSQFRGSGPPPLSSSEYAANFNQTKILGALNSTVRTPNQTEIALFWDDDGGTCTPPGHWNEIAQVIATGRQNTLDMNARLFGLLNICEADAAIVAWDDKYAYSFWRPITATRLADPTINPQTIPDPTWTPLITTPNFPEYVSGHSTFSGAAAQALENFYGVDDMWFIIGSDGLPSIYHAFRSFSAASNEAGMSRIYAGIHYQFSNIGGLQAGNGLANYAFNTIMRPLPRPRH